MYFSQVNNYIFNYLYFFLNSILCVLFIYLSKRFVFSFYPLGSSIVSIQLDWTSGQGKRDADVSVIDARVFVCVYVCVRVCMCVRVCALCFVVYVCVYLYVCVHVRVQVVRVYVGACLCLWNP